MGSTTLYRKLSLSGVKLAAVLCACALAIAACVLCPTTAFAKDGTLSGDGSEASPYLIEDAQDLVARNLSEKLDTCRRIFFIIRR